MGAEATPSPSSRWPAAAGWISAAAVLYLIPFFQPRAWVLGWFALWPMLEMARAVRPGQAFRRGYALGLILFPVGLYWIGHVSVLGLALMCLVLALYIGLFCSFVSWLAARGRVPLAAAAPAVWTAVEYARCHLISPFPWLILGHSQSACLPMIQIADAAGAYGVSFVCAAVAAGAAELRFAGRRAWPQAAAAAGVLALTLAYGEFRLHTLRIRTGPRVAVVQGNIPQEVKLTYTMQQSVRALRKHVRLSEEAAAAKPDMVVWPETMCPGFLNLPPGGRGEAYELAALCRGEMIRLARRVRAHLLIGYLSVRFVLGKPRFANTVRFYAPDASVLGEYDKMRLVPFGEYRPLANEIPLLRKYVYPLVEKWCAPMGDLEPGVEQTLFDLRGAKFGVLICFEDVLPYLARGLRRRGADFAVNVTNDGWFKGSAELDQHNAISAFRAVENRLGMVRAANTGTSSFISPTGEVYAVLERGGAHRQVAGWAAAQVRLCSARTVYTRVGDLWAWLCIAGACLALLASKRVPAASGLPGPDSSGRGRHEPDNREGKMS